MTVDLKQLAKEGVRNRYLAQIDHLIWELTNSVFKSFKSDGKINHAVFRNHLVRAQLILDDLKELSMALEQEENYDRTDNQGEKGLDAGASRS